MMIPAAHELRLILGDQLHAGHSWFQQNDADVLYVIAELRQETDYVLHHVQKITAFFAAMAAFAQQLRANGHRVLHLTLDDTAGHADLPALLNALIQQTGCREFRYQRPDEFRLAEQLASWSAGVDIHCRRDETEHFLLAFDDIGRHFQRDKRQLMEAFYRRMRKSSGYLMDGDEPEGGAWNFDHDNRNRLTPSDLSAIPAPLIVCTDVSTILARLERHGVSTFGVAKPLLPWPVTRHDSLELLGFFCAHLLPNFGRFQDAMTAKSPHAWSLYHSRLSFALNAKLLTPREVIETAIAAYRQAPDRISLAQIEGFVRQILGWREFVRGIYWANMPAYGQRNALNAQRELPAWYWTGKTRMNCLHHSIEQSLEHAYAHHIQRLMVTGNFAMLIGVHPDALDAWYLGIYIDALEWVEMPNTRGMASFADGGLMATKPYAASGNYLQKMSDYCEGCHYQVKQRTGPRACPFNSLYWRFVDQHLALFARNPRLALTAKAWQKREASEREALLMQAERHLANIDHL